MIVTLLPLVAGCNAISRMLSKRDNAAPMISREEVRSLAKLAHESGAIDTGEARILHNLIALRTPPWSGCCPSAPWSTPCPRA